MLGRARIVGKQSPKKSTMAKPLVPWSHLGNPPELLQFHVDCLPLGLDEDIDELRMLKDVICGVACLHALGAGALVISSDGDPPTASASAARGQYGPHPDLRTSFFRVKILGRPSELRHFLRVTRGQFQELCALVHSGEHHTHPLPANSTSLSTEDMMGMLLFGRRRHERVWSF